MLTCEIFFLILLLIPLQLRGFVNSVNCEDMELKPSKLDIQNLKRSKREKIFMRDLTIDEMFYCMDQEEGARRKTVTVSSATQCRKHCWNKQKHIAAVRGSQCACYRTVSTRDLIKRPLSFCPDKCRGDNEQNCGGETSFAVYTTGFYNKKMTDYKNIMHSEIRKYFRGCRKNPTPNDYKKSGFTFIGMVPELCMGVCGKYGYKFFLVSSGNTCTCRRSMNLDKANRNACNKRCSGNKRQRCGGRNNKIASAFKVYSGFIKSGGGRFKKPAFAKYHYVALNYFSKDYYKALKGKKEYAENINTGSKNVGEVWLRCLSTFLIVRVLVGF